MSEVRQKIPARLESAVKGGYVTGAKDIVDDALGKAQSVVNEEHEEAISDLQENVGTGGSVDERIAAEGERHYLKIETYNKTELNNMITTPNQQYISVTATDQTTAVTDILPATGSANTVYRVGNWDGSQFDTNVYSEYAWNGNSYVHLNTKTQVGEVFDISAHHATGGELAKYADLTEALGIYGANIPEGLRRGGITVKYVQSSDNKYVQYCYVGISIANADFTNLTNWIEITDFKKTSILFDGLSSLISEKIDYRSINYSTGAIQGDLQNRSIYVIKNKRYNEIVIHARVYGTNFCMIAFYNTEMVTTEGYLKNMSVPSNGLVTDYSATIPSDCKLIVVSNDINSVSNPSINIYQYLKGAKEEFEQDILSKKEESKYTKWREDVENSLRFNYISNRLNLNDKEKEIPLYSMTKIYEADFSSQESFENDFIADSYVDQIAYPHVISRPMSQAVVQNGSLLLNNTLDVEETEDKGIPRFYCANVVLKDNKFPYNIVTKRGMIDAKYRICQTSGVNNSFWGNAIIDDAVGQAYFHSKYPNATPPETGYMAEIDVNEGKYPNIIDMATHCWHPASLDESVPAGNIANGGSYFLNEGDLLGHYQYNIHFPLEIEMKTLRLTLRKITNKNMHISKLFFYNNNVPCGFPNVLSNIEKAFQCSLNATDVIDNITYDDGGMGYFAEHICDNTIGTEYHYITNSYENKDIVITFKEKIKVQDIIIGTGWGAYNNIETDGKIVLSYKENENDEWSEIFNNDVDIKVMSDIYDYKFVWDEHRLYWLLNNKLIRVANNDYLNRIPQIRLSTMVASFAGNISEDINGTYMQVYNLGIYTW